MHEHTQALYLLFYLLNFRHALQKCVLQGRSQNVWRAAKREFSKVTQRCAKENVHESKLSSYILKFGFSGFGVTAAGVFKSRNQIVLCREAKRIDDISPVNLDNPELTFEWTKFFKYLYPHIWYLLLALSVSIYKSAKVIDKSHIVANNILAIRTYRVH